VAGVAYWYLKRHIERYNEWISRNPTRAKELGFEELPFIPLHGLRHSFATLLNSREVNIVDISKMLGHKNCTVTMNVYAHSFDEQKHKATNTINEFIAMNA